MSAVDADTAHADGADTAGADTAGADTAGADTADADTADEFLSEESPSSIRVFFSKHMACNSSRGSELVVVSMPLT